MQTWTEARRIGYKSTWWATSFPSTQSKMATHEHIILHNLGKNMTMCQLKHTSLKRHTLSLCKTASVKPTKMYKVRTVCHCLIATLCYVALFIFGFLYLPKLISIYLRNLSLSTHFVALVLFWKMNPLPPAQEVRVSEEVCCTIMNWIKHPPWLSLELFWGRDGVGRERERDNKNKTEREREVLSRSSEAQPTESVNVNLSLLIAQHYQQQLNFKATWCAHSTPTDLEKEEKVVYVLFPSRLSNATTAMFCAHVSNKSSWAKATVDVLVFRKRMIMIGFW